jgi:hypothetical protein
MASMSDFEKMRMGLIQSIASASTPEKVAELLAKLTPVQSATTPGESPADAAEEPEEVVEEEAESAHVVSARATLRQAGPTAFYRFGRMLAAADTANTGVLSDASFEEVVFKALPGLPRDVFEGLTTEFAATAGEKDAQTGILYNDCYEQLLGEFNHARQNASNATFNAFAKIGTDGVHRSLASVINTFSPDNHPDVKSGRASADEIAQNFFDTFTCESGNGRVAKKDWDDFARIQSAMHDTEFDWEHYLRRTWKMPGMYHLNKVLESAEERTTPVNRRKQNHGNDALIYRGQLSVTSPDSMPEERERTDGKRTFLRDMQSHMKGASALSTEVPEYEGQGRFHPETSQAASHFGVGMVHEKEEERRQTKKSVSNSRPNTLSGSGVDPGELEHRSTLRVIQKTDHFAAGSVGVAGNNDGEEPVHGLKPHAETLRSHFEGSHVPVEDPSPSRGLKRIVPADNMVNSGLSNAELETLRTRESKSMTSDNPYYWKEQPAAGTKSKKNMQSEDVQTPTRGKAIKPGQTPGGNSQIVFG